MGCGVSKNLNQSIIESLMEAPVDKYLVVRDPEDLELTAVVFKPSGIDEYDRVFSELEGILAGFITWNNTLNDYATNTQNALALGLGGLSVDLKIAQNIDYLHLDLVQPLNKLHITPPSSTLRTWVADEAIKNASEALAATRFALMDFLSQSSQCPIVETDIDPHYPTLLSVLVSSVVPADQSRIVEFNKRLADLQNAIGTSYRVFLKITPAAAKQHGKTALARIMRSNVVFEMEENSGTAQLSAAMAKSAASAGTPKGRGGADAASTQLGGAAGGAGPSALGKKGLGVLKKSPLSKMSTNHDSPAAPERKKLLPPSPSTLLDVLSSGVCESILKAERSVVLVANELARASALYGPPLSIMEEPRHIRKVRMLPVSHEHVEVNRRISDLNAVLFKLHKACAKSAWTRSTPLSNPDLTMPDLPFMVCEAARRVAAATWKVCKDQVGKVVLVSLVSKHEPFKIAPVFVQTADRFRFDLKVEVDEAMLLDGSFPGFLPPEIQEIWEAVQALVGVMDAALAALTPKALQLAALMASTELFAVMVPDVAAELNMDVSLAVRTSHLVAENLALLNFVGDEAPRVFWKNFDRLAAAFSKAAREIKTDLQKKAAELSSRLPRGLMKPLFSPELLSFVKDVMNPAEVAATMSLALTAGDMNPAQLALLQQELAQAGGMAPALHQMAASQAGAGSFPGTGPGAGMPYHSPQGGQYPASAYMQQSVGVPQSPYQVSYPSMFSAGPDPAYHQY